MTLVSNYRTVRGLFRDRMHYTDLANAIRSEVDRLAPKNPTPGQIDALLAGTTRDLGVYELANSPRREVLRTLFWSMALRCAAGIDEEGNEKVLAAALPFRKDKPIVTLARNVYGTAPAINEEPF